MIPAVTITILPGECWCRNCGRVIVTQRYTRPQATDELEPCCDHPDPVLVTEILKVGEYQLG